MAYELSNKNNDECREPAELASQPLNDLLCCPLCGGTGFDMSENTDNRVASIYCDDCPYGVEDSTLTLAELKEWHNTRAT